MMNRVRPLAALLCCLPLAWICAADTADPLQAGWQELSLLNPGVALDHFTAASGRMARYGEALALLNAQPRTAERIARAQGGLVAVQAENPHDDLGLAATFYLARIQQLHAYTPDEAAALSAYRALLQAHPANPVAELAAPKLALLLLLGGIEKSPWDRRVAEIEALLPQLGSPAARRDTRLILADALIRLHGDHARAYPLLTYCLEAGLVVRMPRLNKLLLQAAESARLLGRDAEAVAHYTRYLDLFPHDVKAVEVRRRLTVLQERTGA